MRFYFILVCMAALLSGCATTEKPVSLKELEARYQALSNEQRIRDNARESLDQTGALVQQAESTWKNDGEGEAYEHQHYLASRSADITEMKAEQEILEAQFAAAKTRQQQLKLALKAEENTTTLLVIQDDVKFGFDKAKLQGAADERLKQVAKYLKQNPDTQVVVEGHTDAIGTAEYNMRLSAQRAEAVAEELVKQGVSKDRIKLQAYGESAPVASNQTDEGRQINRRAEIIIPKIKE
ncbi:MAG: OmpA family protein [Ketobacteraceae bacterium]|nr:OmpA family protein [Ketobacteraceae bacterium]